MKKDKVEIGKKVEFHPAGGCFGYNDSDRTLRYTDYQGEEQKVTVPEGFTMRFQISTGCSVYYIVPDEIHSLNVGQAWSYHSAKPITQDNFSDIHESVFGKSSLLLGGEK